ncbi:hypothetical protein [Thiothrix nivea]|uniref:Uncharacterized protein n=1 Tax=Thiothrix nivea (strain ATCC 35100 / DSM 5205 / JP2) TaxID=870187 RepID=A0A656H971_THINJ|nr:hypothetical protein [Thiothrix nivea]EIJ33341.1 hypothetical protein Thini_0704 [Thiothrix nivea DSM 5205]
MSLQLQCPACGASFDLREARADQDWRDFVVVLAQFPQEAQWPLLNYMELFKPARQTHLRSSTMLKIASELLPMVRGQELKRKGTTHAVTIGVWAAAMQHLASTLEPDRLPLKGNGYLLETLANRAERMAAKAESAAIEQQRSTNRQGSGMRQAGVVASSAISQTTSPEYQPYERLPAISEEQAQANRERIRKMLDDAFHAKQGEQP